jgi:hypothetical protein
MIPRYLYESALATHYWDRIGQHYVDCHGSDDSWDCWACDKTLWFQCHRLEIGTMTKWPEEVRKLSLAEQAEERVIETLKE